MVQVQLELLLLNSYIAYGVREIIMCDTKGAIYEGRSNGMNEIKDEVAKFTNRNNKIG